jgi:hypothetical protein
MRMLRRMCDVTKEDRIRNEYVRNSIFAGPRRGKRYDPTGPCACMGPHKLSNTNITLSININSIVPYANYNPCGFVIFLGNGLLSTKIKTIKITHSFELLYANALVKLFIVHDGSKYSIYLVI